MKHLSFSPNEKTKRIRKRFYRKTPIGVPIKESIEYKILQLKKELGKTEKTIQYQVLFLGEWQTIDVDTYRKYLFLGMNVRVI